MSANLDPVALLANQSAQIDRAVADAQRVGAGWLMVDQNGIMWHVAPLDVAAWGVRQSDKDR
ncbi:hypothetical protein [Tropicimonas aquimaris]|uniref:Uncharacterized protein n=1 Tax=Tropicimonas aquimaris TaxID=914152 RepID=A0ABW3IMU8_9RHOB